ncbi:hypothetical protein R3P38DRAFT_3074769 [Favolaschia claudopus]|uniref:Uncharacterized protein n=1 Tax=Favolaschia claudopus TaxID=2862362 RepID=A0AAV9ZX55_9AGAR
MAIAESAFSALPMCDGLETVSTLTPSSHLPLQPRFPPELERIIFEIAASRCFPKEILTFMLVAWRVKTWVEPFLYRIVAFPEQGFIPIDILVEKVASVQYLFWNPVLSNQEKWEDSNESTDSNESEELSPIPEDLALSVTLHFCSDVTNLFLGANTCIVPKGMKILHELRYLQRLTINSSSLFLPEAVDFAAPFLSGVTHLELLDDYFDVENEPRDRKFIAGINQMPQLTHLAFNVKGGIPEVHDLFYMNKRFQCFVFFEPIGGRIRIHMEDIRFVYIYPISHREDWLRGATEGRDYWTLAEEFIAGKRAKVIDRHSYFASRPVLTQAESDSEAYGSSDEE